MFPRAVSIGLVVLTAVWLLRWLNDGLLPTFETYQDEAEAIRSFGSA